VTFGLREVLWDFWNASVFDRGRRRLLAQKDQVDRGEDRLRDFNGCGRDHRGRLVGTQQAAVAVVTTIARAVAVVGALLGRLVVVLEQLDHSELP